MASSDLGRCARRLRRLAVAITTMLAVASCTHTTPTSGGGFDDQKRVNVPCLNHQTQRPGTDYTGAAKADTSKILVMLHYYVANGSKPYCDGAQASNIDRSWAELYVTLGGDARLVKHILGRR